MSGLLKFVLLQPLDVLLNHFLQRDPTLLQQLFQAAPHKVMAINCSSPPELSLALRFDAGKVTLLSQVEGHIDVAISGSRSALMNLLTEPEPATALYHPELILRGDIHLLQSIHHLISRLELDWPDFFAGTATQVGALALKNAGLLATAQLQSLRLDVQDFLQEETTLLPSQSEYQLLTQRLTKLRQRLDRAEAKIKLLQ